MSAVISSASPHVATAASPLPEWGRNVKTEFCSGSHVHRDPGEISMDVPHHIVVVHFKSYANRETRLGGARIRTATAMRGSCEVVPAGADYWARWHVPKESVSFSLSEAWLDQVAQADLDLPGAHIMADAMPVMDQRVAMIGNMLRDELTNPNAKMSALHVDSLFNLLAIHLLREYGEVRRPKVFGGLTERQLKQIQDYMNAHLAEHIRLDELAALVGFSSSQLLRSFQRLTGTSPHQYLTRLRLDNARALIACGTRSLAEISLACGFSSQSHLTSVMRSKDGVTPGALRS